MNPEQNPQPLFPSDDSQPVAAQPLQPTTNKVPVAPSSSVQTASPVVLTPQRSSRQKKLAVVVAVCAAVLMALAVCAYVFTRSNESETVTSSDSKMAVADKDKTKEEDKAASLSQAEVDELHKFNVAKFSSAIGLYWADNTGKLPSIDDIDSNFISKYLSGNFNDPSTDSPYIIVDADPASGEMQYKTRASCGNANTVSAGDERQAVIRVLLSSGAYYCMDY